MYERGFRFMTGFRDITVNKDANKVVYEFWQRKIAERMRPGKKKDLVTPTIDKMPYFFGTKR